MQRASVAPKPRKQRVGARLSFALLGNESWELFHGIPSHFSLRTRIRVKLQTSWVGYLWEGFQTALALIASTLYVVQTYQQDFNTDNFDLAALIVFSFDYVLNFYCCENRLKYVLSFTSIMDAVTIVPALVERISPSRHGTYLFLRFIRVLRLLRLLRLVKASGTKSSTAVHRQVQTIILLILCIVFISAGIFHAVESSNRADDDIKITFGDALYYLVVTVTTVGYGDISPHTSPGKVVATCVIIISFTIVPSEISRLNQLVAMQSPFRRAYQPLLSNRHVLIVGHVVDARGLLDFLKELYHPDRITEGTTSGAPPSVIMGPGEPSESILQLLDHPVLENRVTYIKGSVLNEEDLCRAGADVARACFALVEKSAGDSDKVDTETVLRLLALRNYNTELELYTQIVSPATYEHAHDVETDHILCVEQLKLSIIAKSCLYPGLGTLVSNLVRSTSTVLPANCESWQHQYLDGVAHCVYATRLPAAFARVTFSQACEVIYRAMDGNMILLGVQLAEEATSQGAMMPHNQRLPQLSAFQAAVSANESELPPLYINPGNTVRMTAGQVVYVMSRSKRDIETMSIAERLNEWLSEGNTMPPPALDAATAIPTLPPRSTALSDIAKRRQDEIVITQAIEAGTGTALTNHIIVVTELRETVVCHFVQLLRQARHVRGHSEYHAIVFLSWSNQDLDVVCEALAGTHDVFIMIASKDSKTELLRAGIRHARRVVLLADRSTIQQIDGEAVDDKTIFHYLAMLRIQSELGMDTTSSQLPIVDLTLPSTMKILDNALKKRTISSYRNYQRMQPAVAPLVTLRGLPVQPRKSSRTSATNGAKVEPMGVDRKPTLRQGSSVKMLLQDGIDTVRCQIRWYNQRAEIRQKQKEKRKANTDSGASVLLPFFAAGYGFSDDVFNNMLCLSFFTPGLIRFMNELLFSQDGRTLAHSTRQTERMHNVRHFDRQIVSDDEDDSDGNDNGTRRMIVASSITQMPVPAAFIGRTFGELFVHWVNTRHVVAIGLYRGCGVPFTMPYVVTGPSLTTMLTGDDLVYTLAQPQTFESERGAAIGSLPILPHLSVSHQEVGLRVAQAVERTD